MDTPPLIEARGITKRFGRVVALRGADFAAWPGEVSALVGDNGAGKSTLITIFFLDDRLMRKRAQEEMAILQMGLSSLRQPVLTLSGSQRQASRPIAF